MIEVENSFDSMKPYIDDQQEQIKKEMDRLMQLDHLDEDGYPTEDALDLITIWHWEDARGWFEFIKSIWAYRDWGWKEQEVIDEISNEKAWCYYISTAGWSGNESIIRAMEKNTWMWGLNWVQSRRGGHYIFQLKEFADAD